jgi:hypothetical protein
MAGVKNWAETHIPEIMAARDVFEARELQKS